MDKNAGAIVSEDLVGVDVQYDNGTEWYTFLAPRSAIKDTSTHAVVHSRNRFAIVTIRRVGEVPIGHDYKLRMVTAIFGVDDLRDAVEKLAVVDAKIDEAHRNNARNQFKTYIQAMLTPPPPAC